MTDGQRCEICGTFHERRCLYYDLREALGPEITLSEEEERRLRWLASWDEPTARAFCGIFKRLRDGRASRSGANPS